MDSVVSRLQEFLENEARSGSMDFGCITPLYVYRMWGGTVTMEEIENGLMELRKHGFMVGWRILGKECDSSPSSFGFQGRPREYYNM